MIHNDIWEEFSITRECENLDTPLSPNILVITSMVELDGCSITRECEITWDSAHSCLGTQTRRSGRPLDGAHIHQICPGPESLSRTEILEVDVPSHTNSTSMRISISAKLQGTWPEWPVHLSRRAETTSPTSIL